jgi:hypothetical protein
LDHPYEFLGEHRYYAVKPEEYGEIPGGTRLKLDGVIDEKPVIKHLRSRKPLRPQLLRYYIETHLTVSGIEVKYEGPAFLRKGEKVTVWGRKQAPCFDAVKIETEDVIIQIS